MQWSCFKVMRSQLPSKKQDGAILMIAMIMIAVLVTIGSATLSGVMAESKSVRAGRALLARERPGNFDKLNTIVRNKQQVMGKIDNAPYLKPRVLDFVSIGSTQLTLNGIPAVYQQPNITRITCPNNLTASLPVIGDVCPTIYSNDINDFVEVFQETWGGHEDYPRGHKQVGVDASNADHGLFSTESYPRVFILSLLVINDSVYTYIYNKESFFIPADFTLEEAIPDQVEVIQEHMGVGTDNTVQIRIVEMKPSSVSLCNDKNYSYGTEIGPNINSNCPSQCYNNVDRPTCTQSTKLTCESVSPRAYFTDVFEADLTAFRDPENIRFNPINTLANTCAEWQHSAIIDCSVNNLEYHDPYIIPQADSYTFTNLIDTNIFSVFNNTNNMKLPVPDNQRDSCSSFPDHTDLKANLFMGSYYDYDSEDKQVIGQPDIIPSIPDIRNSNPYTYWTNFIDSSHELLISNPQVQALKANDTLNDLIVELDAPWITMPSIFSKIAIGWLSANPQQIVSLKFYDSDQYLRAERHNSDPDCDDGSCLYDWDCGSSGIKSFDYWYNNLPYAYHSDSVGYYVSAIGNVACNGSTVLSEVKPNANALGLVYDIPTTIMVTEQHWFQPSDTVIPNWSCSSGIISFLRHFWNFIIIEVNGRCGLSRHTPPGYYRPVTVPHTTYTPNDHYLTENKKAHWDKDDGELELSEIGPRVKGIAVTTGSIVDYVHFIPYDGTNIGKCTNDPSSPTTYSEHRFRTNSNYCVNVQGGDEGGGARNQHSTQNSHQDGTHLYAITCPSDYVKEFKWLPQTNYYASNDQYSDIAIIKDIRCSNGTTLQDTSGRTHYGAQSNRCPSQGTSNNYRIWCDGEPLPPYDATSECIERGFGAESSTTIRNGATTGISC